jgi:hypothetical protein
MSDEISKPPVPRIFIEVVRVYGDQSRVVRHELGLRDWLHSFSPSGHADRVIHEALGEAGWRP